MPEFPTRIETSLIDSKQNRTCILPKDVHHLHRFNTHAFTSPLGSNRAKGNAQRLNIDHACCPEHSAHLHIYSCPYKAGFAYATLYYRAGSQQTASTSTRRSPQNSILFHIILRAYIYTAHRCSVWTRSFPDPSHSRSLNIPNGAPVWLATSCSVADPSANQLPPKYGEWVLWMGD